MIEAFGKSILKGIAIGKIKIYKVPTIEISDAEIDESAVEGEIARFEAAIEKAIEQQNDLYEKALVEAGEDSAGIFEAHAMMLEDEDLQDGVRDIITDDLKGAEYAVENAFNTMADMFANMDNDYFKARAADIIDIKQSVLEFLLGLDTSSLQGDEPSILVAEDFAPPETAKLDTSRLRGMVTREGSTNSHTAILARSMNLPALIQCKEIEESWDGKMAILDGYNARVIIDPDEETLAALKAKQEEDLAKRAMLEELKGKENVTIDGTSIRVYANIGGPKDVAAVKENDAGGVGLFRSEFVYLGHSDYPTEDEQFEAYKKVLSELAPKLVIIRTCDIGADKTIDYMNMDKEENPALGFRAIRICLTRKDFFKTQLRALLRASAFGNLGIMFPMIISLEELVASKTILEECRKELEEEGVAMGKFEVGIMIETPAAALCADELAEEVDFFSIGTNDLTQYTLAIDRQNAKLEPFLNTHHPAVLKAIQMTVEAGHRHNTWVGICGELGADQALTETFLRMGVDELSVNPVSVLPLRKTIREIDLRN